MQPKMKRFLRDDSYFHPAAERIDLLSPYRVQYKNSSRGLLIGYSYLGAHWGFHGGEGTWVVIEACTEEVVYANRIG